MLAVLGLNTLVHILGSWVTFNTLSTYNTLKLQLRLLDFTW